MSNEVKETMFPKVQEIMAKQVRRNPSDVTLDSNIKKDLGADSLDILQLLMRIEDDHGIVIPDESLAKFVTVRDVVEYLDSHNS